jgi:small subunit ribosomal protein S20
MPKSLSARKRLRQNVRRRARNRAIKSRIRTARRAFDAAAEQGDAEAARREFRTCQKMLHRAAANGPLHRNTAGRLIGRMEQRLAQIETAAGSPA